MTAPAVVARDVYKRYGRRAPVLAGVDLEVAAGSIVALAGSNGSGKSTMLRCIAGIARFEGNIEVCGRSTTAGRELRRNIGYLPQSVMLPPHATVFESLAFFARLRGVAPSSTAVPPGFLPDRNARIGTLSGGQRQRLTLAIALLGRPPVVLLDEPVSNLDAAGREAVWATLREVRDDGATVLIASPSPADLAGVGDRTVLLHEGRIVDDSPSAARSTVSDG